AELRLLQGESPTRSPPRHDDVKRRRPFAPAPLTDTHPRRRVPREPSISASSLSGSLATPPPAPPRASPEHPPSDHRSGPRARRAFPTRDRRAYTSHHATRTLRVPDGPCVPWSRCLETSAYHRCW